MNRVLLLTWKILSKPLMATCAAALAIGQSLRHCQPSVQTRRIFLSRKHLTSQPSRNIVQRLMIQVLFCHQHLRYLLQVDQLFTVAVGSEEYSHIISVA